jgi:hypothetical protein
MKRPVTIAIMLFCSVVLCSAQEAGADSMKGVHFEITPYLLVPWMGGEATVKGTIQPIDASAGDIFSNLQMGFMARTQLSYNRWFVGTDTVYMGLGRANSVIDVGFDQWAAELLGGYRVHPRIAILTGVRYNSLSANFKFKGPLATNIRGSQVWWDPFLGGVANFPLSKKLSASVRFDVGGFGAGSRIAVNGEPLLNYRISKRLTGMVGWKFLYQDYVNTGQQFEYDVLTQGPLLGMSIRW